jgi:hypothetical protein
VEIDLWPAVGLSLHLHHLLRFRDNSAYVAISDWEQDVAAEYLGRFPLDQKVARLLDDSAIPFGGPAGNFPGMRRVVLCLLRCSSLCFDIGSRCLVTWGHACGHACGARPVRYFCGPPARR